MLFWLLFGFGVTVTFLTYFGVFDLKSKYFFLFLLVIGIVVSVFLYNLDLTYLGFNRITYGSVTVYLAVTLLGVVVILMSGMRSLIFESYKRSPELVNNIFFYSLASSPAQEFVFRSYPLAMFNYFQVDSVWVYVFFSAFCFSLAHLFLKNVYISVFTFIMGAIWAWVFYYFPDLLLISISHTVLGICLFSAKIAPYEKYSRVFESGLQKFWM